MIENIRYNFYVKCSVIEKQILKRSQIPYNCYTFLQRIYNNMGNTYKVKRNKIQDTKLYLYFDHNYVKHNLYRE